MIVLIIVSQMTIYNSFSCNNSPWLKVRCINSLTSRQQWYVENATPLFLLMYHMKVLMDSYLHWLRSVKVYDSYFFFYVYMHLNMLSLNHMYVICLSRCALTNGCALTKGCTVVWDSSIEGGYATIVVKVMAQQKNVPYQKDIPSKHAL